MKSTITGLAAALVGCLALAACGGGVPPTARTTTAPAGTPTSVNPVVPQKFGKATLSITFPPKKASAKRSASAKGRAPQYISPNSDTIYVSVLSIDGTPVSGSSYIYAIPFSSFTHTVTRVSDYYSAQISLPAGSDVLALGDAEGGLLLSYADGFTVSIVPGSVANLSATLNGVAVEYDPAQLTYQACYPANGLFCAIQMQYQDPQLNTISGSGHPVNGTFTATATDATNGATTIALTSGAQNGSTIQLGSGYFDSVGLDTSNIPAGETDQVTLDVTFPAITTTDFGSALTLFGGQTESITFSCTNAGCSANGSLHLVLD